MICKWCGKDAGSEARNFCNRSCYIKHYNETNRERIATVRTKWYESNASKVIEKINTWRDANPEKVRAYNSAYKKRCKKPLSNMEKLKKNIRSRVLDALSGKTKPSNISPQIGCTWEELVQHLESMFHINSDGVYMTWENYGKYSAKNRDPKWQIDHIVALGSFDLEDPEQFAKACHYTNLQPLWHDEHVAKTTEDIKKIFNKK